MPKRRIVDPKRGERVCPSCGRSLSWVKRVDLERVPIQFRCPPGQQPQAYEVRCRVCSTRLVGFFEGDAFELLRDQASALESLGNRDRENLEDTVQRTLERSQNK